MKKSVRCASLLVALFGGSSALYADDLIDAITGGSAYGDFRLRYESVDQDNVFDDATALTLRSRVGYNTDVVRGFSATMEFEDSRIVLAQDDYTVGPTGFNSGEYSVIADPETTELDQGFIQYTSDGLAAKVGRQVIAYDGHRFIGHVGWRQDRQTFDGLRVDVSPVEAATISYSYLNKRNRIFAEVADLDTRDHLFNAAYKTPIGRLAGYAYLLENDTGQVPDNAVDTVGVSFKGDSAFDGGRFVYALEFARQDFEQGAVDREAEYRLAEFGVVIAGITAKLSHEVLGSDEGLYGFATPLATLHKFNGWADMFLTTPAVGLVDNYATLSGKLAGGAWTLMYHDFSADADAPALDELGSELDISYARKFGKHYSVGIKYAAYNAVDFAVDTDKFWLWLGLNF